MSRRSRKRRAGGGSRSGGRIAVALLTVVLLAIAAGYGWLRTYLHSDGFRKFLSAEAGAAAGVEGEFRPFFWDGLAVRTAGFRASGEGWVREVRAEGLDAEVSLAGVGRGVWELQGAEVGRLVVMADTTGPQVKSTGGAWENGSETSRRQKTGWLPRKVEVHGLKAREVEIQAVTENGVVRVQGMSVRAEREGTRDAYRGELRGGMIRLPQEWLPEIRLADARLRYRDGSVFLIEANASAWNHARLELAGEWNGKTGQYAVEGLAQGIEAEELLNEDWSRRITGSFSSTFTVDGRASGPSSNGELQLQNGVLTALPVLDALSAYADTRRFRVMALSEARTDWQWRDGEMVLNNLVMASEGLMRVEGRLVIRDRNLDGVFRVGLAPGTLSKIPGAETDVFVAGERGLLWAPLHLTGTIDDPKEDITDRLVAVAGARMFDRIPETGEQVLKFTKSVLDEAPSKVRQGGEKFLEEGSEFIREVEGVLGGILGGRPPKVIPADPVR